MIDYPAAGTIFDLLGAHGISWANYHHVSAIRVNWRLLSHAWGLNFFRDPRRLCWPRFSRS